MPEPSGWITINGAHVPIDKSGNIVGGMGGKGVSFNRNMTIGQLQQAHQAPDLTAYENASNSNDIAKMNELAKKYPNDARYHVHEGSSGTGGGITDVQKSYLHATNMAPGKTSPKVYEHLREIQRAGKPGDPLYFRNRK